MKVVYYCPTFYPENSGYSNAFLAFSKALTSLSEIDIEVFTPKPLKPGVAEVEFSRAVTINRLASAPVRLNFLFPKIFVNWINSYRCARAINKRFRNRPPDILFVETFEDFIFLFFLKRHLFDRLIVRIHATAETEGFFFFPGIYNRLGRLVVKQFIAKRVMNIAATNQYHLNFSKKYFYDGNVFEIARRKFFVIPNTLPFEDQIGQVQTKVIGSKTSWLSLGRLNESGFLQKGFEDILSMLFFLKSKLDSSDIQYTIVGDGTFKSQVEKIVSANFSRNVKVVSGLTNHEVLAALRSSDVVILPSRFEGLSMFALEALATGNVLVFSRTGGLIDLVNDENGFLHDPQDIQGLADAMEKVLKLDSETILNMKIRSQLLYQKKFAQNVVASQALISFNCIRSLQMNNTY